MSISPADARFLFDARSASSVADWRACGCAAGARRGSGRSCSSSACPLAAARGTNCPPRRRSRLSRCRDSADSAARQLVIPVYGHFPHTLACLRALAAHPPQAVRDHRRRRRLHATRPRAPGAGRRAAPTAAQQRRLHRRLQRRRGAGARRVRGVPQQRHGAAAGLAGCAAAHLRRIPGRRPGRRETAVSRTAACRKPAAWCSPTAAAGTTAASSAPTICRYAYVRDADYCSAARRSRFRARCSTSSAASTRATRRPTTKTPTSPSRCARAGKRVLYQPAAVVVHVEGATSGTDTGPASRPTRSATRRVRGALARARWRQHPPTRHADRRRAARAPAAGAGRRCATPAPDHDSGSLRLVNLMRLLRDEGAHVVFLPANRSPMPALHRALQQLGVEVLVCPYAARAPAWLREHGPRFDAWWSAATTSPRYLPLVRRHAPQARMVFDTVDLHYLRERARRRARRDRRLHACRRTHARAGARGHARSRRHPGGEPGRARAADARRAPARGSRCCPTCTSCRGRGRRFAQRHDLLFVGGFRHPPNVDARAVVRGEVLPLVRAQPPGRPLPLRRQQCARRDRRRWRGTTACMVHGHVPDLVPSWTAPHRGGAAALRRGRQGQDQPQHGARPAGGGDAVRGRGHAPGRRRGSDGGRDAETSPPRWCAFITTRNCGTGFRQRPGKRGAAFSFEAAREAVRKVFFCSNCPSPVCAVWAARGWRIPRAIPAPPSSSYGARLEAGACGAANSTSPAPRRSTPTAIHFKARRLRASFKPLVSTRALWSARRRSRLGCAADPAVAAEFALETSGAPAGNVRGDAC